MKSIFEYEDYRSYMNEYYLWKKRCSSFSWRQFSKNGGFTSPNFMKMVCEGKSGLSKAGIERAANAMELVGIEREYFKQLVYLNQSKNDEEKKKILSEIAELKTAHDVHILEGDSLLFYASWKYPLLRELAPMMPGATHQELSSICGDVFSAEEIRDALAYLVRANFLKKISSNTYEQVNRSLQVSSTVLSTLVRAMHKEMAHIAHDAIEKYSTNERNFTGITMGIDDQSYSEILKELESCRKRIISIATAQKSGNRVYRLNMQLFPLTKKI